MVPLAVFGQTQDTLHLPEIRITEIRMGRPDSLVPYRIERLSIQARHASLTLGDALLHSGSVVRGYGPGVLQTVAYRGFTASQTQVLWNGWALNHGMVGVSDLSLIPSFLLDDVVLNRAGGSAEYGNAAIGGIVELNSGTTDLSTTVHAGAGSFGAMSVGAKTGLQATGWTHRLGVYHRATDNDFPYTDVFRFPIEEHRRQNAATHMNAVSYSLGKHERDVRRHLALWLSAIDSEIPGPISAGISQSTQSDAVKRLTGSVVQRLGSGWIGLDAIASIHDLDYIDPLRNIRSLSAVRHAGLRGHWSADGIRIRSEVRYSNVDFTEYAAPDRIESSMSATWIKGMSQISARIDHDSFYGWFWSGSLGHRTRHFRAYVARSFGVPTFNDLYWPLLGNRDLTPETAVKAEAGWVGRMSVLSWDVPVFAARVNDGIQWIPQSDGRVRPANLRDISTLGSEPALRIAFDGGPWRLDVLTQATYTRARTTKSRFPGDQSVNRRVAYVPEWQYLGEATLSWASISVTPTVRHTGERFTTEDERFPMEPTTLWDLSTATTMRSGRMHLTLVWRVENALNEDYSLIRWYPMPGRQHHLSIQISFP